MSRIDAPRTTVITDEKHVLGFGKYKGCTITEILEVNPQYLLWLQENTQFDMDHKLVDAVEEAVQKWRP